MEIFEIDTVSGDVVPLFKSEYIFKGGSQIIITLDGIV